MKKVILIPIIATSALLGCQDQTQVQSQNSALEVKQQAEHWVGHYAGSTPCMSCLSRCDDCPGMTVALTLNPNETYELVRASMSGHNEVESFTGQIRFCDDRKQQIELMNVAQRNLIFVNLKDNVIEIREDQSAKKYQMQSDFLLARQV